jgi:hypothetical protein
LCRQNRELARWRPPGQPHFGEIVERVIGTLMAVVHALRGTTFSNVDNAAIRQRLNGNEPASFRGPRGRLSKAAGGYQAPCDYGASPTVPSRWTTVVQVRATVAEGQAQPRVLAHTARNHAVGNPQPPPTGRAARPGSLTPPAR